MPRSGTLTVDLKVSLLGQGLVTIPAALVVAVVFYLQLSLWIFLGVLVITLVAWALLIQRINRFYWRRLVLTHGGAQMVLVDADQHRVAVRLDRRLIVSGALCCIAVRAEANRRYWLWLFPDSTDTTDWRRLVDMLRQQ